MQQRIDVPVQSLGPDLMNPRIPKELRPKNSRDAYRRVAENDPAKLIALANHVIQHGLNLATLPIVIEAKPGEFTVLDGNRRLTALRMLEAPDLMDGIYDAGDMARIRKMSTQYSAGKGDGNPVAGVLCVRMDSRKEADPWIQLNHRGQASGAGVVPWDGRQGAQYDSDQGRRTPELRLLDQVAENADLPDDVRTLLPKFPITTFGRLVADPDVRKAFGFDVVEGELFTGHDAQAVLRVLADVVTDLARGKTTVSSLKSKEQRAKYVEKVGKRVKLPDPNEEGETRPFSEALAERPRPRPKPKPRRRQSGDRETLIPKKFRLDVDEPRLNETIDELARLKVKNTTNTCAVMLRTIIDWSITEYIDTQEPPLTQNQRQDLHARFIAVLDDMKKTGRLKPTEVQAMKARVNSRNSIMAIPTLHAYVHNVRMRPIEKDLLQTWDVYRPFIEAAWNASEDDEESAEEE